MRHFILFFNLFYLIAGLLIFSGCTKGDSVQSGSFIDRATAITNKGDISTNGLAPVILSGRVVDAISELGLNSATVKTEGNLETASRNDGQRDGIFALVNAPVGPYFLTFSKSGYEILKKSVDIKITDSGKTIDLGDVKLYPEGSPLQGGIKGFVYNKSGGAGINGALLSLENGVTVVSSIDQNYSGAYLFPRTPLGTYNITITSTGFKDKVVPVTVERLVTTKLDIILEPLDQTVGTTKEVTTDISGRVIDSQSFLGINGVTVSTEGGISTVTSNDEKIWDGCFRIKNVPIGSFNLLLTKENYFDVSHSITVEEGSEVWDVGELKIIPKHLEYGTVKGIIYASGSNEGVNDVLVTLEGGLSVTTDNNSINQGAFIFDGNAPVGTYTLSIIKPGYLSKISQPFTVLANNILNLSIYIQKSQSGPNMGTVTGKVVDTSKGYSEVPREAVRVYVVTPAGETLETKTISSDEQSSMNGTFTLLNIPAGTHTLWASLENYNTGKIKGVISIPGTITRDVEISIKSVLGSIKGFIYHDLDTDGIYNPVADYPLGGAEVVIVGTNQKVFSRVNGSYTFSQVNIGDDYIISAEADIDGQGKYLKNYIDDIDVTVDNRNITNVNIDLIPVTVALGTGHVTGYVISTFGEPVEDSQVEIDPGGTFSRTVLTESDGYFFINSINAGTYVIRAAKVNFSSNAKIATVPSDNSAVKLENFLIKPYLGNITGIIYNDVNSDGLFTLSEDQVVVDAEINAKYGFPEVQITTKSAQNGQYILNELPYGNRVIKVTHSFYGSVFKDFDISSPNEFNANIALMSSIGGITGEVIEDLPNGIPNQRDPGESRVKDAIVTLLYASNLVYTTGSDGCFHFKSVPVGDHLLKVEKFGSTGNSRYVKVVPNSSEPISPVTMGISNYYGAISGMVFDKATNFPLGGITVEIQGNTSSAVKTDNKSGSYLIGSIVTSSENDNFVVIAWGESYETTQSSGIKVFSGKISSNNNIYLDYKKRILTGSITDSNSGKPVSSAEISIEGQTGNSYSDGSYKIENVRIGSSRDIFIRKAGYRTIESTVSVLSNTDNTQNFILTPVSGTIGGRIVSYPDLGYLAGATIEVIGMGVTSESDKFGIYRMESLSSGNYTFMVSATSYETVMHPDIDLAAGENKNGIDITLTRSTGIISGVITDDFAVSSTISSVSIVTINCDSNSETDQNGKYNFEVPTGKWNFKFFKSGYETHVSSVINIKSNENSDYNVKLKPALGSFLGVVLNKEDGTPISGVTIEIKSLGIKTLTHSSGSYVLTGIPVGNYGIFYTKSGYEAIELKAEKIKIPGEQVDVGSVKLSPVFGTLFGKIQDAYDFAVLKDAEVTIKGNSRIALSNVDGEYKIENIIEDTQGATIEINLYGYRKGVYPNIVFSENTDMNKDFLLTPAFGRINGDIVDSGSSLGISGARVFLKNTFLVQTTDSSGNFSFLDVSAIEGTATLEVWANNYDINILGSIPVKSGEQTSLVIPMNANSGTITGVILDSVSEEGLKNARIVILNSNKETSSYDNGLFSLNDIKYYSGGITLEIIKNGYTNFILTGVTVTPGSTKSLRVLLEATSGSIVGQIFSNVDQNPIAGASVRITSLSRAVTTDARGYYEFKEITAGTTVSIATNASEFAPELKENIFLNPSEIKQVDFHLEPIYGVLAGKIINFSNGDSIENATVLLTNSGLRTSTSVHGQFEFLNLASFTGGTIEVLMQGFARSRKGNISVLPGKTSYTEISITPNYGSVSGIIISEDTNSAIDGAIVTIPEIGIILTTGADGYFMFENVQTSNISVQASAPQYDISQTPNFVLIAGKSHTVSIKLIPSTGTISGRVIDSLSGEALQSVKLDFNIYNRSIYTDINGNYIISDLRPSSNFSISSYLQDYMDSVKSGLNLERGKTLNINFFMTPNYGVLSGQVYDVLNNMGLSGISVLLIGSGVGETTTDVGGFYSFNKVPAATGYRVNASGGNYVSGTVFTPAITGGSRSSLNIPVSSIIGSLSGIITDSSDNIGLTGVKIIIPSSAIIETTGLGGYYYISGLQPAPLGLTIETSMNGYFSHSENTGPLLPGIVTSKSFSMSKTTGVLSGVIRDSATNFGIIDVTIMVPGSSVPLTTSTEGGYYEFIEVPVSMTGYTVEFFSSGYVRKSIASNPINSGKQTTLNVSLVPTTGIIAGEIISSSNNLPVTDVTVFISGTSFSDATGAAGEFEIYNVPVSTGVTIETVKDGYKSSRKLSGPINAGKTTLISFDITPITGTISGLIKSYDTNEPVENALVVVGGFNLLPVYSNIDGIFSISEVPISPAGVTIDIYKRGFLHYFDKTIAVEGGKNIVKNVALQISTGTLSGWITDSRFNTGISEASIIVVGGHNIQTISTGEGYYEITGFPMTSTGITIEVSKTGYRSINKSTGPVNSGDLKALDFILTSTTGILTGKISDATTGVQISAASIKVIDYSLTTVSDSGGIYAFNNIPDSSDGISVEVVQNGYYTLNKRVSPFKGGTSYNLNFELTSSMGSLTGRVTDSVTLSDLSDTLVLIRSLGLSDITDSSGYYSINNIPSNTIGYSIEVNASGYSYKRDSSGPINSGTTHTKDFSLDPYTGSISGLITDSASSMGLSDVRIYLLGNSSSVATSDASGLYAIFNLPEETSGYVLEAQQSEYVTARITTPAVVGGENCIFDFQMGMATGVLSGIIRDSVTGLGVALAEVRIPGTSIHEYSNTTGYYSLDSVTVNPIGVTVVFSVPEYFETVSKSTSIVSGFSTTMDVVLTPSTGTIIGVIYNSNSGVPISNAIINISGNLSLTDTTDVSGSFQITQIPVTSSGITIEANSSGFHTLKKHISEFYGGITKREDFYLTSSMGTLSGFVTNNSNNYGISGVRLSIQSSTIPFIYSDSTGYYSFSEIPVTATGYSVEALHLDYFVDRFKSPPIKSFEISYLDIKLKPAYGTVVGFVKDSVSNLGISGALIRIYGTSNVTTSVDGGYYTFNRVYEKITGFTIETSYTGYETLKTKVVSLTGGQILNHSIGLLSKYGTITGIITDSVSLQGISGVRLQIPGIATSFVSQSAGYYLITNVPVSSAGADIIATATGYDRLDTTTLGPVISGEEQNFNFSMDPFYVVFMGTITDVSTLMPLSNAKVSLQGTQLNVFTDANGSYTISNVPESITGYNLEAFASGYTRSILPSGPANGGRIYTLDFSLHSTTAILTGYVYDVVSNVGIRGATLNVTSLSSILETSYAGGNYQITGIPVGNGVTIEVTAEKYYSENFFTGAISAVNTNTANFTVTPSTGILTGVVRVKDFLFPIEDAEVILTNYNLRAKTDSSGFYEITDIPAFKPLGDIKIVHEKHASKIESSYSMDEMNMTNLFNRNVNFELSKLFGKVSGSVVDANGEIKFSGIFVLLKSNTSYYSTFTDQNGDYIFPEVNANETYTLIARKSTQLVQSPEISVEVQPDYEHIINIQLYTNISVGTTIYGQVFIRDVDGSLLGTGLGPDGDLYPAEDWNIYATGPGYSCTTDQNGRFILYYQSMISDATEVHPWVYVYAATKEGTAQRYATGEFFKATGTNEININFPWSNTGIWGIVIPEDAY